MYNTHFVLEGYAFIEYMENILNFFNLVRTLYADKTEWRGTNGKSITRTTYMYACTYFYTNVYTALVLQLF
jgi:hypothetical protein